MHKVALARMFSASAVLLLLLGAGTASAAPSTQAQTLSLAIGGAVSDLGTQNYKVQGGPLITGMVDGIPLNPATTSVDYAMNARVNGLDTSGNAHIHLTSSISGGLPTQGVTWSTTAGTIEPSSHGPAAQTGCNKPDKGGQVRCDAQFTADGTGAAVVTATYPGDPSNSPSSGSFTIFVGNMDSSPATSTSLVCDQPSLQVGQSTNCHATVNTADSSAEDAGVTWSTTSGTISLPGHGPAAQTGCNKPDKNGQMRCDAQFTATTAGTVTITATYTPTDAEHTSSSGSYTVFAGIVGPSTATSTSLTCDRGTLDAGEQTNCHATVVSANGDGSITLDANVKINGQVGTNIPLGCGASGTPCNSELPTFFMGPATINIGSGDGPDHPSPPGAPSQQPTMLLESPYFNPWGGPIVLASSDGSVFLALNYSVGTIDWRGTTVQGLVGGTLDSTQVSGFFTLVSQEHEDLVTGIAKDSGRVTLSGMSNPILNTQGMDAPGDGTAGFSVIPKQGSAGCGLEEALFQGNPCVSDCTGLLSSMGLPTIPGSCTSTGFQDVGALKLHGQGGVVITGGYSTTWMNPALVFVSGIQASVTQPPQPQDH